VKILDRKGEFVERQDKKHLTRANIRGLVRRVWGVGGWQGASLLEFRE
jgi:hypothetical protein